MIVVIIFINQNLPQKQRNPTHVIATTTTHQEQQLQDHQYQPRLDSYKLMVRVFVPCRCYKRARKAGRALFRSLFDQQYTLHQHQKGHHLLIK